MLKEPDIFKQKAYSVHYCGEYLGITYQSTQESFTMIWGLPEHKLSKKDILDPYQLSQQINKEILRNNKQPCQTY